MYSTTVLAGCVAQHHPTVPNPGLEGVPHSHHHETDLTSQGSELNEYDSLVDTDAAATRDAAV